MIRLLPLATLASLLLSNATWAAPNVVASIKPIHSLVAAVMQGVAEPTLIVKGAASPHTYALRPSDASALEAADIVFWTGSSLELFLADALDTLAPDATKVELTEAPGVELLAPRESGAFEVDTEDHGHAHGEEIDPHFFLDPQNAKLMVSHIAGVLAEADPDNAARYQANAETERSALDALSGDIAARLETVKDKPFVVFHDAYQYFEKRFDLAVAGSITLSPDAMPGAAGIDALRAKVSELGASCVFAEPNFKPTIVDAIIEGTSAKAGVLDPEGSTLPEGVELYPTLMRDLANNIVDCLS
ncbi:zinc ABC transporter substrate-binding protein [Devosia sp. PTR5]|uniref:High-affinity zinc uptake system protein ZnuA n=1 Tax=Devosia oryzisoli TaxID=2774138 RepID=A0A927IT62_9HYPH|nr:zinc ABC transporter substrate-binding protein [Devosia oryzisoli]MBD8065552.1 zinc ABC transporter substrate-binding protein [Devosia oryzisoli]